jgi:IMP dehydrogenase
MTEEATRPELMREALGFDDIGLIAADQSNIASRKQVYTYTKLSKNITIEYPIISSPMDTISDVDTCIALNNIGAAGILHRFMSIEEQVEKAEKINKESGAVYVAIGLGDYEERINTLLKSSADPDLLFLDTANGASIQVTEFMRWWNNKKKSFASDYISPDMIIGNTMSKASVSRAFNLGADGVRHGIGIGSMCITSMQTGIHCPAVTSLYYGWKAKRNYELQQVDSLSNNPMPSLLCDGGIRKPADLVKAIISGADAVICGNIFAGCNETPGKVIIKKPIAGNPDSGPIDKYKKFRGMASAGVVEDYGLGDGTTENRFIEGEETLVRCNGKSVVDVVHELNNGLRSAMSYLDYEKLKDMKGTLWTGGVKAIRLTNSSYIEGTPHGK